MTTPSGAVSPDQVSLTASPDVRPLLRHDFASRLLAEIGGDPLPRLETLLASAASLHLAPGDRLSEPGKSFTSVVLVERGLLAQRVVGEGLEVTVAFLGRGDVSGNLYALYGDLLRDLPSAAGFEAAIAPSYRVAAVTEARVILLDARVMATLAGRHAAWATLRSRLLLEQTLRQAQREEERLTCTSEERYERLVERSPEVAAQLTQREIARYLRISEVTMSRLMARRRGRHAAVRNTSASLED